MTLPQQKEPTVHCGQCGTDCTNDWVSGPGLVKLCPDCGLEDDDTYGEDPAGGSWEL